MRDIDSLTNCDSLYNYLYTNNCDSLFKCLFTDNICKALVHLRTFEAGKTQIPCFIDFIDIDRKTSVGFEDPWSSMIFLPFRDNYLGIKSAYSIDYILTKDSIETEIYKVKDWNEWEQKNMRYRIYPIGVIVRIQNGIPVLEPLEYEDMKIIKIIYLKWWEQNKEKSIETLRNEWRGNKHILEKNGYRWI